jgi:hypothetical protein
LSANEGTADLQDIQILATVVDAAGRHIDLGQGLRGSPPQPRDTSFLFEHDLFRKSVPTFRDHALSSNCIG